MNVTERSGLGMGMGGVRKGILLWSGEVSLLEELLSLGLVIQNSVKAGEQVARCIAWCEL